MIIPNMNRKRQYRVLAQFQRELNKGDYRFLLRTKDNLKAYANIDIESGDFNYSNLCLFRSPYQKDLLEEDYVACYETFKFLVREMHLQELFRSELLI